MPVVVNLVGSPNARSRSRALAVAVVDELLAAGALAGVDRQMVDLAEIAGVTFTEEPAVGCAPVDDPVGRVCAAQLLIVATPTYKGAYSGLLKTFLDQLHRDAPLSGVVAAGIITAHSAQHHQATAHALTALLHELGATVATPHLLVLDQDDLAAAAAQWATLHGPALSHALRTELCPA